MKQHEIRDLGHTWQHRLGLAHWDIEFPFGDDLTSYWMKNADFHPAREAHACIERSKVYDVAKIYVNPDDYESWTEEEGTRHIVHELVHIHFRDVEWIMDQVTGFVSRDVENLAVETFQHHLEGLIDRMAKHFIEAWEMEDVVAYDVDESK